MALNFPGPYGLRMFYTTTAGSLGLQHTAEYNIDLTVPDPTPGTLFSALSAENRIGAGYALDTFCDDWVALLRPLYSSAAGNTFDYFELWQYEPESFDASFVSSYTVGLAGSSASPTSAAAQDIWTWRTGEGGVMKLSFMETVQAPGAPDTAPLASAPLIAIYDFVLSDANIFIGRDGAMPFALIARYPGTNEALFKQRFRP